MDQPKTAEAVNQVLQELDQAMDQIREVSQSLAPSPCYRIGLRNALEKLIRECRAIFQGTIQFKFSATARLEPDLAALLYDAIASALDRAMGSPGSSKVNVSVTGAARVLTARIQDNGRTAPNKISGISLGCWREEAGFPFSQRRQERVQLFSFAMGYRASFSWMITR